VRISTKIFELGTVKWRQIHSEELCRLYPCPSILRLFIYRRSWWWPQSQSLIRCKQWWLTMLSGQRPY